MAETVQTSQISLAHTDSLQTLGDQPGEKRHSILQEYEKYLPRALLARSPICKHELGCFENGLRRSLKTFMEGFGALLMLKLVGLASKPSTLIKQM